MSSTDSVILLNYPEATSVDKLDFARESGNHIVVIPVSEVNMPVMNALHYARLLGGRSFAVHILIGSPDRSGIEYQWELQNIDIPLMVLDSPERSLIGPLREFVSKILNGNKKSIVTVVLPVITGLKWWQRFLHNQTAKLIEKEFQNTKGVVTIRVPFSIADRL